VITVMTLDAPATGAVGSRAPSFVVPALSVVVLTVAILQTAVVPVMAVIGRQLHASPVAVSWVVTANLLAAAAATPLIGRIADLRNKKTVLLVVLALVLAGSALAATTASLPLLILGRVLQGAAFSLYPVAVSILRDEIPADRLIRSIAMLSAMLGFGGGLGLVVTGLLMTPGASYQRVFWLCTVFTAVVSVIAAVVVPSRPRRGDAQIDWIGGISLAIGLSALLLTVTQGRGWGLLSPATLGTGALGVGILIGWWMWSRRCPNPLVSTAMLSRRPILRTNAATLLVGMALYFSFLGLTDFVETSREAGYGFGATVLNASVEFLLPGALAAAATALVSGRLIERFGARAVVRAGASAGFAGFAMLVIWHSAAWQVVVAGLLTNAYISLAYGALPVLIVQDVAEHETGIATSLNAIARKVGSGIAAAIVGALLITRAGGIPPEWAFTTIFSLGAATAVGTVLLIGGGDSGKKGHQ
jgi:MFS family permease